MTNAPLRALSAFYGLQGKQDGFVAAQAYASNRGLKYTVIDMLVELGAQNQGLMKPIDLADFDFLNFSRASRSMSQQVAAWLEDSPGTVDRSDAIRTALAAQPLRAVLAQWPALVDDIADTTECGHLKVIAFPALTSISERPISIGNVPHRHWASILEATCRLNPTVRITLDSPLPVPL